MVDAYVLIMSCEDVWFLSYYVRSIFSRLFSGCLRRNAKISKDTRSTNSRTPDLRSSDSPWQSYKRASPRVEGFFQWNEPLKIWNFPGFVRKSFTAFFMALPLPSLASCLGTGRQYKLIRGQQYCIIGICIALSATAVTRKKVNSTAAALWPNQLPVRSLFWE